MRLDGVACKNICHSSVRVLPGGAECGEDRIGDRVADLGVRTDGRRVSQFKNFGAPGRPARSRECKSLTVKV
jgi:hypothetical protein